MRNLIIIIGNIGSGKSTYAKKYQEQGYVIISRDQLRYAIGNGEYIFNPDYELAISITELDMFKRFASLGVNILVDGTSMTKTIRKRYIDYILSLGYTITAIEMPHFGMGESVNRRMIKPHGQFETKIWCQVWADLEAIYEAPSKEEGFHKIIKVRKNDVS